MKMPRWLVVSLLTASLLTVLGYGAWWWVKWPDRTTRDFVGRVASHDDSWMQIVRPNDSPQSIAARLIKFFPPDDLADVEPQPRSIIDVILSRRTYKTQGELGWVFTVQRGIVICPSEEDARQAFEKVSYKATMERAGAALRIEGEQQNGSR